MISFILGWILIAAGILGFTAGQILMNRKKREIREEVEHIQKEG